MSPQQTKVPLRIVNHLGEQLGFEPTLFLPPTKRPSTLNDQRDRIRTYLEFQPFSSSERELLVAWLKQQDRYDLRRSQLNNLAREFLLQRRTIVPAESTLNRLINTEVARQESISFDRLAGKLSSTLRQNLEKVLDVDPSTRISTLQWLTQYPPEAKPKTTRDFIERIECLVDTGMGHVDLSDIRPSMLNYCSRLAERMSAHKLRRLPNDKRWALVFSLLHRTRQSLLDHVVEMHRTFLITLNRRARLAVEKRERQAQIESRKSLGILLDAMEIIVDDDIAMEDRAGTAHHQFGSEVLSASLAQCRKSSTLNDGAFFEEMRKRHSGLKQYLPLFLKLPFEAEPHMTSLMKAVEVARSWHAGDIPTLPADVSSNFAPKRWQTAIKRSGKTDRPLWEIALAVSLNDALRSGDVYLSGSKNHVSFWDLAYSPERWETEKSQAYSQLHISQESAAGVATLQAAHHVEATALADGLASNEFLSIDDEGPHFRKQPPLKTSHSARQLRRVIQTRMRRVRIEELLAKVDSWCGFSKQLTPLEGRGSRGERPYRALMAALVAHGTNLGITTMAQSTKGLSVSMLHDASAWNLRPETFKAANRVLVDYHQSLPISRVWGDGATSSSDGQRFSVQASTVLGSFYPRYFGYYDRALTIYTHISDQYSVFGTRVISCGPREAVHVLDGLIESDSSTPSREHFTDTHGATDQIFGLCHLLGYSFRPRLKDLKDQKLYRVSGDKSYGEDVDSRVPTVLPKLSLRSDGSSRRPSCFAICETLNFDREFALNSIVGSIAMPSPASSSSATKEFSRPATMKR